MLLVTHELDEAEALCDRVVAMRDGRVLDQGTPAELVARHAGEATVRFTLPHDTVAATAESLQQLNRLPGVAHVAHGDRPGRRPRHPRGDRPRGRMARRLAASDPAGPPGRHPRPRGRTPHPARPAHRPTPRQVPHHDVDRHRPHHWPSARPRPRRQARRYRSTTRRLLTTELRLLARDPLTLTFVLVFPIVTMLIIGGSFGTEPDEVFPVNPSHWYVASYFTVVIGATGLIMLPVHIASYRERGVLRRFAASGFPRWSFALAQLAIGLIAIAIAGLLLLAVAAPVYGVPDVESPAPRRRRDRGGLGRLRQHRRPARDPAPVRAGRAGDRAAALLPLVPARCRRAAAGGDVGRAAADRGPASRSPWRTRRSASRGSVSATPRVRC